MSASETEKLMLAIGDVEDLRARYVHAPEACTVPLLKGLHDVALAFRSLGFTSEADAAHREAIALGNAALARYGESHEDLLTASVFDRMHVFSYTWWHYNTTQRYDEALALAEKFTAFARSLRRDAPEQFAWLHARALRHVWSTLDRLKRYDEALPVALEALALRRSLPERDTPSGRIDIATALFDVRASYIAHGPPEKSLAYMLEIAEIYRGLARDDPERYTETSADTLMFLVWEYERVNNVGEAEAVLHEVIELYRSVEAEGVVSKIGTAYRRLIALHRANGQGADAVQAATAWVASGRKFQERLGERLGDALENALEALREQYVAEGLFEDGLVPLRELIALRQANVDAYGHRYLGKLSEALRKLGLHLLKLHRHSEALDAGRRAVAVAKIAAATYPHDISPPLIAAYQNLKWQFAEMRRYDDALATVSEAVEYCRAVASTDPANALPTLAAFLRDVRWQLGELDRLEDGIAPISEAIAIYRDLAATDDSRYGSILAESLRNLDWQLVELGRYDEALAVAEEAVALHRRRSATDSDEAARAELATALERVRWLLATLTRHAEAATIAKEAAALYEALLHVRPDVYRVPAARAFLRLRWQYAALNDRAAALTAMRTAITLLRGAAADDREAVALANEAEFRLADDLYHDGQCEAAARILREAVAALDARRAYFGDLRKPDQSALLAFSAWCRDAVTCVTVMNALGATDEAVMRSRETVAMANTMFENEGKTFADVHCLVLKGYADVLIGIGLFEDAVAVFEKIIAIKEPDPEERAVGSAIAWTWSALSFVLRSLGRRDDMLTCSRTAVEIASRERAGYGKLAVPILMFNHAVLLSVSRRHEEAFPALLEALESFEQIDRGRTASYSLQYAKMLTYVCGVARMDERWAEAVVFAQRALDAVRALPQDFLQQRALAAALVDLAKSQLGAGNQDEALAASRLAVDGYRELRTVLRAHPLEYASAPALRVHADVLAACGRHEDALAVQKEAVEICRTLAERYPPAYSHQLASALTNESRHLLSSGRYRDALERADEAVARMRPPLVVHPEAHQTILADALLERAKALYRSGRPEAARADLVESSERFEAWGLPYRKKRDGIAALENILRGP